MSRGGSGSRSAPSTRRTPLWAAPLRCCIAALFLVGSSPSFLADAYVRVTPVTTAAAAAAVNARARSAPVAPLAAGAARRRPSPPRGSRHYRLRLPGAMSDEDGSDKELEPAGTAATAATPSLDDKDTPLPTARRLDYERRDRETRVVEDAAAIQQDDADAEYGRAAKGTNNSREGGDYPVDLPSPLLLAASVILAIAATGTSRRCVAFRFVRASVSVFISSAARRNKFGRAMGTTRLVTTSPVSPP